MFPPPGGREGLQRFDAGAERAEEARPYPPRWMGGGAVGDFVSPLLHYGRHMKSVRHGDHSIRKSLFVEFCSILQQR